MSPRLIDVSGTPGGGRSLRSLVIVVAVVLVILLGNPVRVIPAGHVGVKDFFGNVSSSVLMPGVRVVFPFTRVVNMSIKTQEVKETAEVPSKEGLTMDLEGSLLYRWIRRRRPRSTDDRPELPGDRGHSAGPIRHPRDHGHLRGQGALFGGARQDLPRDPRALPEDVGGRGIISEAILLRKIGLPPIVANAIQEKLRREQEAEQMKFVLQKESQEAQRKRIEAQGIADFQRIVASGISQQLLEWKGIEATEKLALSQNTKVVVIGNQKSGLPIILGGEGK